MQTSEAAARRRGLRRTTQARRARPFAGSWAPGLVAVPLVALLACDGNGTGPATPNRVVSVLAGDDQIAAIFEAAPEPLQVVVSHATTEEPLPDVTVTWEVVLGSGASLSPTSSTTDSSGVASTVLSVGADTGFYEVRARVQRMVTEPPLFRVRAIADGPVVHSVQPAQAAVGDTVTLSGEHFSTRAEDNRVLFAGIRALVLSATTTSLEVVVPPCLPTRDVEVTVRLGPFVSPAVALDVAGDLEEPLDLAVGEVVTLADPGELDCLLFPESSQQAEYLIVAQNAADAAGAPLRYQLVGVAGGSTATLSDWTGSAVTGEGGADAGSAWELRLRLLERELPAGSFVQPGPPGEPPLAAAVSVPELGDRRTFQVFNKDDRFSDVRAEVVAVSDRTVIYQDLDAPAGGFTAADFQRFGEVFDDPIHPRTVQVYGAESDIDENQRVIILFTPVVNELTPSGSEGFVAGFFFGLDLTTQSGSNRGEIFYSLVPDPQGRFGEVRHASEILDVVPPVLAHEFQHMIHFNQRILVRGATSQESLWLSEGLAHMAEDLVGDAFAERGETDAAVDFKVGNFARALFYLRAPDSTSLIVMRPPGGLAERGASWLFLKYLMGHYGGEDLIRRLTQTVRTSVTNVGAETGQSWSRLFGDWAVATFADEAPELDGVSVEPRYTYTNEDLRAIYAQVQGGFPLRPSALDFSDFVARDTLPPASPDYYRLSMDESAPRTLNLRFAGAQGDPFSADAAPQLSIMRLR